MKTLPQEGRVFAHWKTLESVGRQANKKGVDFRKLRRSFVTHLRLQGVEHDVVARWATHTMAVAAKHYVCPTNEPIPFTYHGLRLPPHGLPDVLKTLLKKVDE